LFFYGYQWWLGRSFRNGAELSWAAGVGLGGQRLYVVPSLDLVVMITAGHYRDGLQGTVPFGIFNRVVLPAVKN
jgi:CubicO group peptidase (beta-lactamase class C family)